MRKVIHRIWLGPNPMPDNYKQFGLKWQELNQDWIVKDWTQPELESIGWINKDVYDHVGTPLPGSRLHPVAAATQQADVLAYELVHRFGGLYVNTDIEPVRPLHVLFDSHPELRDNDMASKEDEFWIVNAILWAPEPGSPFWQKVIDALPARYYGNIGAFMNQTTGPHLLSAVAADNPGLVVLDRNYFNPVHFTEVAEGHDADFDPALLPLETIGVHHWGHRKNSRPHTASID